MQWNRKKRLPLLDERTGIMWPNAELSARDKLAREYVAKQFWLSVVEDQFDLAECSFAIAVMDKIGGW